MTNSATRPLSLPPLGDACRGYAGDFFYLPVEEASSITWVIYFSTICFLSSGFWVMGISTSSVF